MLLLDATLFMADRRTTNMMLMISAWKRSEVCQMYCMFSPNNFGPRLGFGREYDCSKWNRSQGDASCTKQCCQFGWHPSHRMAANQASRLDPAGREMATLRCTTWPYPWQTADCAAYHVSDRYPWSIVDAGSRDVAAQRNCSTKDPTHENWARKSGLFLSVPGACCATSRQLPALLIINQ